MLEELLQKLQAITADAKTALSAASTPADVEAADSAVFASAVIA